MDKKILKILQKIRIETEKFSANNCKDNITEMNTNDYSKFQAYNNCVKIIIDTLIEEDEKDIGDKFIKTYDFGKQSIDVYHNSSDFIAYFDDREFKNKTMKEIEKDLRYAIISTEKQKGNIVDEDEMKNSSLV